MSACACGQEGGLVAASSPVVVEGVAHGLDKCVGLSSGQEVTPVPQRHKGFARTLVLTGEQRDRLLRIEQRVDKYAGGPTGADPDVRFLLLMCDALVMRLAAVELEGS